jgi:hypothetical protein
VGLYLYSPSGPSWPVLGWPLPFTLIIYLPTTVRYHRCNIEELIRPVEWRTSARRCAFTFSHGTDDHSLPRLQEDTACK